MSIYASMWSIKVESHRDEWVEVYAQGVSAHIGQPSEDYEVDPYADFLPPIVTPYNEDGENPMRAVVIVQRGFHQKEGQKYINPIATMTGIEYEKMTFVEFLTLIYDGIKRHGIKAEDH